MIVFFDDREPEGTELLMDSVDKEIKMLRMRMEEGDYLNKDVVIERKTIDDFCSSIMDGRIKSQIEKMKEKYNKIYMVIVGRVKDRTSEINENSVLGMIVSLIMKHNIKIVMVDDEVQFMFVMKRIFERNQDIEAEKFINETIKEEEDDI